MQTSTHRGRNSLRGRASESNSRGFFEDEKTKQVCSSHAHQRPPLTPFLCHAQTLDWKQGFDFGHTPRADLPPDHPSNQVLHDIVA